MIPIIAFAYVLIAYPLLGYIRPPEAGDAIARMMAPRIEHKIFWPLLVATTIFLAMQLSYRLSGKILWSPPVTSLIAYMAFSAASIMWAFSPEYAFSRYCLELMVVVTIILPYAQGAPITNTIQNLYRCYAIAVVLNVVAVLTQNPILTYSGAFLGHAGYFPYKQGLGECASVALLFAFHQLVFSGRRPYIPILIMIASVWLAFASNSKGSLAFLLAAPVLAGAAMMISRMLRTSAAAVLAVIPLSYLAASMITKNLMGQLSLLLFNDWTMTGRTYIWDFMFLEMSRRPWLGWGFHSFWLIGPNSPAITDGWGWVKTVPGGHSGFLDVRVETGNVGIILFVVFIFATLHAIQRVRQVDPVRAWLLLSLALYIISTNFVETVMMAANEPLWLLFLFIVAETTRYSPAQSQRPIVASRRAEPQSAAFARRRNADKGIRR